MPLEEIRKQIDSLDSDIVRLLARRAELVSAAGTLKMNAQAVRDPNRVEQVLERVRTKASDAGLDPAIAEEIYRTIISCFVRKELREFSEREGAAMDDKTKLLKETFDTVSTGYDDRPLRFFPESAKNLAEILRLRGDERALDVACGTGHASFALAARLPRGRVIGVDFSSGMLERARRKGAEQRHGNVDFLERDMRELGFRDDFDLAICAFGIFFVEDMDKQLGSIVSAIKPGGRVAITCFRENYFSPLKELFLDRLAKYHVATPPPSWKRIAHEAGCRDLFAKADLVDVRVETRNVGYHLDNAEDWWSIVWNAGYRRLVSQLSPQDQRQFKREHLQEIEANRSGDGIWLDVGVLYTVGTKRIS